MSLFKNIKKILVAKGSTLYRKRLKMMPICQKIALKIVQRGWITPEEIQIAFLEESNTNIGVAENSKKNRAMVDENIPYFHWSPPLNFSAVESLSIRPHINILIPSLKTAHMSGGPNTALLFAAYLTNRGEHIRLISTDASIEGEDEALYEHLAKLFQKPIDRERIVLVDGFDRLKEIPLGINDLFMATAWWTAQIAQYAVKKTVYEKFIYLIQDFEPILHAASTFQARALETYGLPHIPVINTRLLLDHLEKEGCGNYRNPTFVREALYFEPAIDRTRYFPDSKKQTIHTKKQKKILLFYARPTFAHRNLFEIGLVALRKAVASGCITPDEWEIWAMGEKLAPISLGNNVFLRPLPWLDFDKYAKRVRTADLLLSLMLSPHPSYPPLEMAVSGKMVVTNSFSIKSANRLQNISPNILVAEPNVDSVASTLESAIERINTGLSSPDPSGSLDLPSSWDESLEPIVSCLKKAIDRVRYEAKTHSKHITQGYPVTPATDYEFLRKNRLAERRQEGPYFQSPGLLSFLTSAFNTDPKYLKELASSLFVQDGGTNFEWFILDNGSTNKATIECLQAISRHPCVRLERVEVNLGIIGGMRYCLERATGRYILPLDSDDMVEPDCIHILTQALHTNGFPALLYTDEDKLADKRFLTPYFKPDWDPVLFLNSCYIAHLCAMDREKALALGLYTNSQAEGCHDWDSFIRFMNAGYVPHHIPEVLYSWRIHSNSTSGNITSKSFISASHQAILQQYLITRNLEHFDLVPSPLFKHHVDWWFKRRHENPLSWSTILIVSQDFNQKEARDLNPDCFIIPLSEGIEEFALALEKINSELIYITWNGIVPDDDEWLWDVIGLSELFPDAVMFGGMLHDGKNVLDGPRAFGFGNACDCPDQGRPLSDPGYFAQMWKPHSVSAVSSGHCVVRSIFLKKVIAELRREKVSLTYIGPWLGALARESGQRVIYSPFMRARAQVVPEITVNANCLSHFISRFWHLLPEDKMLSNKLGLTLKSSYSPRSALQRTSHLMLLKSKKLPYEKCLEMVLRRRRESYPLTKEIPSISVLTTVYERSNWHFLDALAMSLKQQTLSPSQWVIVAHGPIASQDLQYLRSQATSQWGATLVEHPQSLGIMGAMRQALEIANGEYILPVDADDLLTSDALQIMAYEIGRTDKPDLLYSDEDLLINGVPSFPHFRGRFDPVLNLDSSSIWHLCAIKRSSALIFGLYSDDKATWCHDWDSVLRIAEKGGRIEHVPEILYHWRQHSGSISNKLGGSPQTLHSVRYLLEQQISKTKTPDLFFVDRWPIGSEQNQLYIARKNENFPEFVWFRDWFSRTFEEFSREAIIVMAQGVVIRDKSVFNEVVRLFDLHTDLAVVGGQVIGKNRRIIDACSFNEEQMLGINQPCDQMGTHRGFFNPRTVSVTGERLAFIRLSNLLGTEHLFENAIENPHIWIKAICRKLQEEGWRIASSPRIQAYEI